MRSDGSWARIAAAVAFGFLGLGLALTGGRPTAALTLLLTALVVPLAAGWAAPARSPSLVRIAWAALALPAAALIGIAAWSSTSLDVPLLRATGALLLVLVWAAAVPELIARGARVRRKLAGRARLVRALPLTAALALVAAAWGGTLLRWPGSFTRMAFAFELQSRLLTDYPHREDTGFDLEALWARHEPRLRAADRACKETTLPCEPFAHALRDWMAELRNGHTWAALDGEIVASDVVIEPVEGRAVVTDAGEEGAQAGLEPGMVVVAVDGVPVARALARLPGWATAYRAARTRRYYAFRALLDGPPDTYARLEVEDEAGQRRHLRLLRPAEEAAVVEEGTMAQRVEPELEAPVEVERLDAGYGYLWLEGFEGSTFATRAEAALDAVADLPGLVLDLRHNSGGYTDLSRGLLGRFFARPTTVGLDCVADVERRGGIACTDHLVEPRGRTYTGVVAVLIDEDVFSAGELAAHGLCSTGRARCFGRPTAGETDAVIELPFPGGHVGYAASDFRSLAGASLFGRGVVPQQLVPELLEDVRAGRDPELSAALEWLEQAIPRRGAHR